MDFEQNLNRVEKLSQNFILFGKNIVCIDFPFFQPTNMLMCGATLKLIDYGSSRFIMTRGGEVGEVVGTAEFMGTGKLRFYLVHTALPCRPHKNSLQVGIFSTRLSPGHIM